MKNFRRLKIAACTMLGLAVLSAAAFQYAMILADTDIWFTMAYGRYFLEHRTIVPDHGIFSWTPAGNSTIYCTWIPSIFYYLLYSSAGLTTLFALRYICVLFFVLLALYFADKKHLSAFPVTMLIVLVGLKMTFSGIRLKAEDFSFICMAIMVWTWFRIKSLQGTNESGGLLCYAFPALMVFWVNSHGGFIFGLAFLGTILAGEIMNLVTGSAQRLSLKTQRHLFFFSIVLSFLAILLNPYGWEYPIQLFDRLILNPEEFNLHVRFISEYQNIFSPEGRSFLFIDSLFLALGILIPLLVLNFRQHKTDWTILVSNALFVLLYIRYMRTTYFWGILFVFTALYLLRELYRDNPDTLWGKPAGPVIQIMVVVALLIFSARVHYFAFNSPNFGFRINYDSPVAGAEFIRKNFPELKRIGNEYNSGSYLMWALWPEKKVLIDARYFPYVDWIDEYNEFFLARDNVSREAFLTKYPCDLWVINYDSPHLQYFRTSGDWKLAYYGPSACVFLSRLVNFPAGHSVSESVYDASFNQALVITKFAFQAGDFNVVKRLLCALKPRPFSSHEKNLAVTALVKAGEVMYSLDRFNDAYDLSACAARIDPDSDPAYFMMASAQLKLNRVEEAITSYKTLIRLKPGAVMARNSLADSFMLINRIDDAIKEYEAARKIDPLNTAVQTNLNLAFQRKQDIVSKISRMSEALKNQSDSLVLLNSLALYCAMIGQYENAVTHLMKVAALTPNNPEVAYNIACMYSRLGRADKSQEWIERAVKNGFKNWALLKRDLDLENFRATRFYEDLATRVPVRTDD